MKTPRYTISILLIFFISTAAIGQPISISGKIIDDHTKEPVSYASVYFVKSGVGKTSDSSGNFSFYFNNFTKDTLVVSYIGYELYKIEITRQQNDKPLNIQLLRGGLHGAVEVRSKVNKGLFLWRKIMSKKKQYNRYALTNFGYEAYNKLEIDIKNFNEESVKKNPLLMPLGIAVNNFGFVFDNIDSTSETAPFLPFYLTEELSDYAYQSNPKKYYENHKATKTPGFENESVSKLLGVMNQNVSIYSNFINVMDKDFVSPFNDNGDAYYNFSVPDTQVVSGKKIYHFVFRPKHSGTNTFEGDAWVTEKTYQIQKISLYLGKDANINYIDRISVFQEFLPINDSVIFLNRDKFYADFRVMGKKSLTLIGRKSTSYQNIIINSDSLTEFFKKQNVEEVVKTDKAGIFKSDSTWETLRHDTLSTNEKTIYETVDKLLAMPKFQRFQKWVKFVGGGYMNIGNFEIGPWFYWISANQWEGTRFRFDLGTNKGFHKNIYLHGYLAYGTLDKKFKGQAEAFWIVKRDPRRIRLHLSYTNDVENGISQVGEVSQDNVFSIVVRKPNTTRKFIQAEDLRFEVFNELGKGFSTEWFVSHRQYTPLKNLPDKSNFPVSSGTPMTSFVLAVKLRFAYLERFIETDYNRYTLGTKYPIVEVMFAQGIPGVFNSAYNYTKYGAAVSDIMKISPYGTLSYKVFAGKIHGVIPYTYLENHPGNDLYYYNPGAYNLMNRFEYISDKFAGVNLEHNIGSGIFRFTPLTRKLKWRQFWNVKSVWGSLSPENYALNNSNGTSFKTLNGKTYIELGTGIDNIFKILRFDFVWLVSPTPLPADRASRFGIFGSLQFQF